MFVCLFSTWHNHFDHSSLQKPDEALNSKDPPIPFILLVILLPTTFVVGGGSDGGLFVCLLACYFVLDFHG